MVVISPGLHLQNNNQKSDPTASNKQQDALILQNVESFNHLTQNCMLIASRNMGYKKYTAEAAVKLERPIDY